MVNFNFNFNRYKYKNRPIDILHNTFLLYFILFLTIINLVSFALINNFNVLFIFIAIAIVTYSFSQNMMVILTISIVCSNMIHCFSCFEGMENQDPVPKKNETETEPVGEISVPHEKKINLPMKVETGTGTGTVVEPKLTAETKTKIDNTALQYKELMKLQEKILDNIGTLERSLSTAEGLVKKMGSSIDNK